MRLQYVFNCGKTRARCADADLACTAKTLCRRMRDYDSEVLGIEHKAKPGEDFYDITTNREELINNE